MLDRVFTPLRPYRLAAQAIRQTQGSGPLGNLGPVQRWADTWIQAINVVKHEQKKWGHWSTDPAFTPLSEYLRTQHELNNSWADRIRQEPQLFKRLNLQVRAAWAGAEPKAIFKQQGGPGFWFEGGIKNIKNWKSPFGRGTTRFLTGAVAWGVLTGAALASQETPEDLKDIYQGKKLIAVRKGRWWEGGGTAWEGGQISRFRPHWLHTRKTRARQRAIWGEDEDTINPVTKFFKKNFTYELEEMHYRDRPYPITGQALDEVPFAKFLLDPIGKLIKPAKLMHTEEWIRTGLDGQPEFKQVSKSLDIQPAMELGGLGAGAPTSPYSASHRFGEAVYQTQEGWGLVGYGLSLTQRGLTGTDTPFSQGPRLSSAGKMTSPTEAFWNTELGGALFLSEPVRRFFPNPRKSMDSYNPVANTMPSWIPKDLRFGDPYEQVKDGDLRLPGPGYEALHPELQGLDPEEYPLHHKYAILSDVASWSAEFRQVDRQIKYRVKQGVYEGETLDFLASTQAQLDARRETREFEMYQRNNETKRRGLFGKLLGGTWGGFNKALDTVAGPAEKVLPLGFRPISKTFPYLDPLHEYEESVLYGTKFAFWDKPIRDWFRPFATGVAHSWAGWEGIPGKTGHRWQVEEYYDKLEYYKWKHLEGQAYGANDPGTAKQYAKLAAHTTIGTDPFGRDLEVKSGLPAYQREFFDAFAAETDEGRRNRILEVTPPSVGRIYEAQWLKRDYERTGDPELLQEINQVRQSQSPMASVQNYFQDHNLPDPDWIGFNPAVDLEDVKLKVLLNERRDIHDYGLWESQVRLLSRKPYLTSDVVDQGNYARTGGDHALVDQIGQDHGMSPYSNRSYTYDSASPQTEIDINYDDNRSAETSAFNKRYDVY